jgi:spermidine synthase
VRPWHTLAREQTAEGTLELRQRGPRDFLLTLAGRVLMSSAASRSEQALGRLAAAAVAGRPGPRLLLGGLGLGLTLRAALDALPHDASVVVCELHAAVGRFCLGPLAALTGDALRDPRVELRIGDVAHAIAAAAVPGGAAAFDAIALDLSFGPHVASQPREHPHYGPRALGRSRAALRPGGVLALWAEEPDPAFERRLRRAGFAVERARPGRGGRRHVVYLARGGPGGSPRAAKPRPAL